jgi:hypothetical protein
MTAESSEYPNLCDRNPFSLFQLVAAVVWRTEGALAHPSFTDSQLKYFFLWSATPSGQTFPLISYASKPPYYSFVNSMTCLENVLLVKSRFEPQ